MEKKIEKWIIGILSSIIGFLGAWILFIFIPFVPYGPITGNIHSDFLLVIILLIISLIVGIWNILRR